MKLYAQADFDANKLDKQRETRFTLLCALPFLAAAVAAFVLRVEWLCIAGAFLCGAIIILRYELRIGPAIHYGRFLREMHSGLTKKTLGTLVRVSGDLTYEDGVNFREVIINIYEDMDEEGERRFLLDAKKEMPAEWLGCDVVLTSYGSCIVGAQLYTPGETAGA